MKCDVICMAYNKGNVSPGLYVILLPFQANDSILLDCFISAAM